MARHFVPVLAPDLTQLRSPLSRAKAVVRPRRNPIGKKARGKRGGWVARSGKGKFEHVRVRPPEHFASTPSLKTVPWAFITDAGERAFVLKKLGKTSLPAGTKVIAGHVKSSVTVGRVAGKRVKHLASGVQAVLLPGGAPAKRPVARKPAAPVKKRPTPRKNPGSLVILNPPKGPIAETAAAMTPAHRTTFLRHVHKLTAHERSLLEAALQTYRGFHKCWPPTMDVYNAKIADKSDRFLVGLGKADHIGYRANKEYAGSSKAGTPWRHHFTSGQHLVTQENGKGVAVLDRRGARRGTNVTDYIRG